MGEGALSRGGRKRISMQLHKVRSAGELEEERGAHLAEHSDKSSNNRDHSQPYEPLNEVRSSIQLDRHSIDLV